LIIGYTYVIENVHQAIAAYKINLGNRHTPRRKEGSNFALIPSVLLRLNEVGMQINMGAIVKMDDRFWSGISYRGEQGFAFLAGFGINGFSMTYSYDHFRNNLTSGMHEITLGLKMSKSKAVYRFMLNEKVSLFF
jgi:hypothetical protein